MSLLPGPSTIERFKTELGDFELAKGTIKYTLENPLPDELIKKMIELNKGSIDPE